MIETACEPDEAAGGHVGVTRIMSKAANSIRKGLEEALAYAKGRAPKKAHRVHVKGIRAKLEA